MIYENDPVAVLKHNSRFRFTLTIGFFVPRYNSSNTMSMSFPPFTKGVKWLVIANGVIFLLLALMEHGMPQVVAMIEALGYLRPMMVAHGWIWQLVTYSFFHLGLFHVLFNMLMLWMFGSQFEMDWGTNSFLEFYFFCVVGAALVTMAVSYGGLLGLTPLTATAGSSGGIFGVLVAFGVLYAEREVMLFPLPFMIKAKYFVIGLIFIAVYEALKGPGGVANIAHLGGGVFGYVYIKFLRRHGFLGGVSERYFGMRNDYYRWKRRRAARKFEVYMRKHDRSQYFDEYGNYRDPKSQPPEKDDGENRGKWVN